MSEITVKVPAKVVLTGEHAVVYGKMAIAAAIALPMTITLSLSGSLEPGITVNYQGNSNFLSWDTAAALQNTVSLEGVISFMTLKIHPEATTHSFTYRITSEVPLAAGLGSSASLCVGLSAVLLVQPTQKSTGVSPDLQLISQYALEGENLVHGKASGLDSTTVALGGFICFNSHTPRPLVLPVVSFRVLIVNSNTPKLTSRNIQKVRDFKEIHPELTESILQSIHITSQDLEKALLQNDIRTAKSLLQVNQGLLLALGLSSPVLDEILQ